MKRRRCIIDDDIFQASWCVQRGGTKREALDWYCRIVGVPNLDETQISVSQGAFYQAPDKKNGVIWFDASRGAGTVAHEVHHAVIHLMTHLNVPISIDTEEVTAYYTDWLVHNIVEKLFYDKKGRKLK